MVENNDVASTVTEEANKQDLSESYQSRTENLSLVQQTNTETEKIYNRNLRINYIVCSAFALACLGCCAYEITLTSK